MASSQAPAHATHSATGHEAPSQHPHRAHHRAKKDHDPFVLSRTLTADVRKQFSNNDSSPSQNGDSTGSDASSSLLTDLIVTPLTMISFILSLVLIDRQQRQWRLSQHNSGSPADWSRPWLAPEPYQAWSGPAPGQGGLASEEGSAHTYSGWYARKKKRAMARMEISDALAMRKRVVFALLVWSALALWGVAYLLRTTYCWLLRN